MDPQASGFERNSAKATEQERRQAPRFPSSRKISCYPAASGFRDRRQGRVRDLSRAGIGLALDRGWPPGTVLVVELPFEQGTKSVRTRVVHTTPLMGGMFLIGCSFEVPITDAEVQALTQ